MRLEMLTFLLLLDGCEDKTSHSSSHQSRRIASQFVISYICFHHPSRMSVFLLCSSTQTHHRQRHAHDSQISTSRAIFIRQSQRPAESQDEESGGLRFRELFPLVGKCFSLVTILIRFNSVLGATLRHQRSNRGSKKCEAVKVMGVAKRWRWHRAQPERGGGRSPMLNTGIIIGIGIEGRTAATVGCARMLQRLAMPAMPITPD